MKKPSDVTPKEWIVIKAANCRADLEVIAMEKGYSIADILNTKCHLPHIVVQRRDVARDLINLGYLCSDISRAASVADSTVYEWISDTKRQLRNEKNRKRLHEKRMDAGRYRSDADSEKTGAHVLTDRGEDWENEKLDCEPHERQP